MPESQTQPEGDDESIEDADERVGKILEAHAVQIGERCESVCIITTISRGDNRYACISRGHGNYFAQYGSVKEWIKVRDEPDARE